MKLILKQFLIIGSIFLIILWFQNVDDKKHNRIRKTFYDIYKFPLLVSSIIGFILNIPTLIGFNCENNQNKYDSLAKSFIHTNSLNNKLSWFNKDISEQQIYTDLPDF
jgi:hypothetical protein